MKKENYISWNYNSRNISQYKSLFDGNFNSTCSWCRIICF